MAEARNERLYQVTVARKAGDVEYVIQALRDDEVRPFAAHALGKMGAVEASADVVRLLDAHDPVARRAAARALGRLRAISALPRLIETAESDADRPARVWAIVAIGQIGADDAFEVVASFLSDPEWRVRRAAVYSLGRLGDARAVPLIKEQRAREPWKHRGVHRQALRRLFLHRALKSLH